MIKKLSFEKLGGYDERYKFAQDYKFFKDALQTGYKFKTISMMPYDDPNMKLRMAIW